MPGLFVKCSEKEVRIVRFCYESISVGFNLSASGNQDCPNLPKRPRLDFYSTPAEYAPSLQSVASVPFAEGNLLDKIVQQDSLTKSTSFDRDLLLSSSSSEGKKDSSLCNLLLPSSFRREECSAETLKSNGEEGPP